MLSLPGLRIPLVCVQQVSVQSSRICLLFSLVQVLAIQVNHSRKEVWTVAVDVGEWTKTKVTYFHFIFLLCITLIQDENRISCIINMLGLVS
jgi:hypothetical protein